MENRGGGGGSAPTGCYKCGRPGHWSRDCPSSSSISKSNDYNNNSNNHFNRSNDRGFASDTQKTASVNDDGKEIPSGSKEKRKSSSVRPKLTPDLLLSDRGIGYILRYIPRALKCRGRGHEVDDLKHLIGLYGDWHSRLLPYYNFHQFVHKVEQVGSTKRVKLCLRELRERVSNGADPTKLHESQVQNNTVDEQDAPESMNVTNDSRDVEQNEYPDNIQNEMLHESWTEATEKNPPSVSDVLKEMPKQSNGTEVSEEQIARMEANRLRALEKASARSRKSQITKDI